VSGRTATGLRGAAILRRTPRLLTLLGLVLPAAAGAVTLIHAGRLIDVIDSAPQKDLRAP
jgi:hypothetical protein